MADASVRVKQETTTNPFGPKPTGGWTYGAGATGYDQGGSRYETVGGGAAGFGQQYYKAGASDTAPALGQAPETTGPPPAAAAPPPMSGGGGPADSIGSLTGGGGPAAPPITPPSAMASLLGSGLEGGPIDGSGPDVTTSGPMGLRQNLGTRNPPQYNYALASLQRAVY